MSMDTVTIRAAQLIYTNVEAEDSPTHRRGFQVWLFTPGLSEGVRREIAKRLGDFRPPTPLRPDDPKPDAVVRHVYFDTAIGTQCYWTLAQTVPLAERDKFGRGGRFLAHALVLTAEEFDKASFNPFLVFRGGLRFHTTLADGKQYPEWRQGSIPETTLAVAGDVSQRAAAPSCLLSELVSWLQCDEYTPVALPEPPEPVLGFLDSLFCWLPPQLRARASFDTLSTGQSLSAVPFRFAGAFSLDALRRWSYRKAYRLDRGVGKITPPLAAADSFFARWLARQAAGCTGPPPDTGMGAAYSLLTAIERGDIVSPGFTDLSDAALSEFMVVDGVKEALPRLQQRRIESDLPDEVLRARISGTLHDYFREDAGPAWLRRLAQPIPRSQLAGWLVEALAADPVPLLPSAEAERLEQWSHGGEGEQFERCRLIAQRWGGRLEPLVRELDLKAGDERAVWLRDWCRRSLQTVFGGADLGLLVRDRLDATEADEAMLKEAELFLALAEAGASGANEGALPRAPGAEKDAGAFDREAIRFLIAYHRGNSERMMALLASAAGNDLYDFMVHRFEQAEKSAEFRCYLNEGSYYLGTEVVFRGPNVDLLASLANACFQVMPEKTTRFWLGCATRDMKEPFTGWRVQPMLISKERAELPHLVVRERWEALTERLRFATDTNYQDFAETVIQPSHCALLATHPRSNALWFGVRVGWIDPNTSATQNQMLGCVVRAVLPVRETETWDDIDGLMPDGPVDRYRVRWLLECLLRPEMIGKLVINRG